MGTSKLLDVAAVSFAVLGLLALASPFVWIALGVGAP